MKTVKDSGIKIKHHWANTQSDAYTLTPAGFLNKTWGRAIEAVTQDQAGILLVSPHGDMLGTVLPASYIEEFQRKLPSLMQNDPVIEVSLGEFRRDFEKYENLLQKENILMVQNDAGQPFFAVANKFFSAAHLGFEENSKVLFAGEVAEYMFTDKVFDPETYDQSDDWMNNLKL